MASKPCRVCGGGGWVCENHADEPAFGGCCGGAGMPCGACNLEMAVDGHIYTALKLAGLSDAEAISVRAKMADGGTLF